MAGLEAVDSLSPHIVSGARHIRRQRDCVVVALVVGVAASAWAYAGPRELLSLLLPLPALLAMAIAYPNYLGSRCPRCRQAFFADRNVAGAEPSKRRWLGNPLRGECANCALSLRAKLAAGG